MIDSASSQPHTKIKSMFLAIPLDEEVQRQLASTFYLDLPKSQIKRAKQRNFHITLGFIPNVKWEDRSQIVGAFTPLSQHKKFTIEVDEIVTLGHFGQILCVQFGPQQFLEKLSLQAETFLKTHTKYAFSEIYKKYIPHTKIQTIKKRVGDSQREKILEDFQQKLQDNLQFKIESLALMERVKNDYEIIKRYPLK